MGRKASVSEADLMDRLSGVFRDFGYEGATLTVLSNAAGLKKASLYHRFPGGKEQMAREVLEHAGKWLEENILSELRSDAAPDAKIKKMVTKLDEFYSGGQQACLLNMLSTATIHEGPFVEPIRQVFETWIDTLSEVLVEAGQERKTARARAERAVILLQGSLVVSRGTGNPRPFRDFLKTLPGELL